MENKCLKCSREKELFDSGYHCESCEDYCDRCDDFKESYIEYKDGYMCEDCFMGS